MPDLQNESKKLVKCALLNVFEYISVPWKVLHKVRFPKRQMFIHSYFVVLVCKLKGDKKKQAQTKKWNMKKIIVFGERGFFNQIISERKVNHNLSRYIIPLNGFPYSVHKSKSLFQNVSCTLLPLLSVISCVATISYCLKGCKNTTKVYL